MNFKSFRIIFLFLIFVVSKSLYSQIIVLNGPCCAGKYSIAKELVEKLNSLGQNWVHFSVKDCHEFIQENYLREDKNIMDCINVMHKVIKEQAEMGINVIVEEIGSALEALGCYKRRDEAAKRIF